MFREILKNSLVIFSMVAVLLLAGCSTPDPGDNPVEQYKFAEELRQKNDAIKSFHWMKRSAEGRYRPAMKGLSWYYVIGYGTSQNYQKASEWMQRYMRSITSGKEALQMARQILDEEMSAQSMEGLVLLKLVIERECELNHDDSPEVQEAVKMMNKKMEQICEYWIKHVSKEKALEVVDYCRKVAEEYPNQFPDWFYETAERLLKEIRTGKIQVGTELTKRDIKRMKMEEKGEKGVYLDPKDKKPFTPGTSASSEKKKEKSFFGLFKKSADNPKK